MHIHAHKHTFAERKRMDGKKKLNTKKKCELEKKRFFLYGYWLQLLLVVVHVYV